MRNVLLTWPLFDLLHGEEILVVVLQHLGEIAKSEGTARFTLILLKIFLQRVMKSFHIFLELLKVLQI